MKTFILTAAFVLLFAGRASAGAIYDFEWTAEISSPQLLDERGQRIVINTAGIGQATLEPAPDGGLDVAFVTLDGSGTFHVAPDGALPSMLLPSCCGVQGTGDGWFRPEGSGAEPAAFTVGVQRVVTRGDVYVFNGRGTRRTVSATEPGVAWLAPLGGATALGITWLRRATRPA